ncbi:MAG: hypothetical protein MJE77_14600 [Proteobacteria bacterium]|nr:hypothetical protein [Pseudomonadota bacterium]
MMARLRFSYKDTHDELHALSRLVARFLTRESSAIIGEATTNLAGQSSKATDRAWKWEIKIERPLRTKPSKSYQRDGKGALNIHACISFKWPIQNVWLGKKAKKKRDPYTHFQLAGSATTRIELVNGEDPVAMWRFEIGDDAAPGCHFHVQVLQDERYECLCRMFPKALDVPRLPTFLITPMDAIQFVIAELFQDEWPGHVDKQREVDRNTCRNQQLRRFHRLFDWQLKEMKKSTRPPWTVLKLAQPEPDLIVEQ